MSTWISSIFEGFKIYFIYAAPITLPVMVIIMIASKRINLVELVIKQLFVMYLCCVAELVFFPLPTMEEASKLSLQYQLIPMHFIADLIDDSVIRVLCQVIFNVAMTVPFGMFLEYCLGLNIRKALLISFLFTAFIEIGQLTGLFFMFKGSYRLFDVDDLIFNTIGSLIGYFMIRRAEGGFIPSIGSYDRVIGKDIVFEDFRII
ncbi:MAG: VanZ family protein [Lachnospiraceae bacterium]|nr:VanZ family protein [Lachnospiraceae bacterium]